MKDDKEISKSAKENKEVNKMSMKKVPYKKPAPNSKTTAYIYDKGKRVDLEVQKYSNLSHIKAYKRCAGNQMHNTITGEKSPIKVKDFQEATAIYARFRKKYREILEIFDGDDSEKIIVLMFDEEIDDLEEIRRLYKYFWEKLKRRLQPVLYMKVWLYEDYNKPFFHIWIKSIDGTKIELEQETVEKIWTNGKVEIVKLTKENREPKARYYISRKGYMKFYPSYVQPIEIMKSDKVKKVQIREQDYSEEEKMLVDYDKTYAACKVKTEIINGKEEVIQHYTYESYVLKPQPKKYKLRQATIKKQYKGNFIKLYKEMLDSKYKRIQELSNNKRCWLKVNRIGLDRYELIGKAKTSIHTAYKTIAILKKICNENN